MGTKLQPKRRKTHVEVAAGRDREAAYRARHRRMEGAGRFVRLVAEGGMGAVLEVRDAAGSSRALKLIKEGLVPDAKVAGRFRRELASHRRLSASFQVPRLVPCEAFSDHQEHGLVFGLFPLYSEGTLEDRLRQGLARREALWILADAVEGLQCLHGLQYVHRDFHPTNVLVEREGGRSRGVLGDLGVGTFLSSNTIFSQTQLDADLPRRVGHPGFIDPVFRASPEADMYAVGATLYRILAGRTPAGLKLPESVPLPLPSRGDVPYGRDGERVARRLLDRLTTPEAGRRYGSIREAREDLVRLAELLDGERPVRQRVALRVGGRRLRRRAMLAAAMMAAVTFSGYGLWETLTPGPSQGAPQPGAPQPGAPQPGAPQPGAPQPGAPQPGAPQLGAPIPSSRQRGATARPERPPAPPEAVPPRVAESTAPSKHPRSVPPSRPALSSAEGGEAPEQGSGTPLPAGKVEGPSHGIPGEGTGARDPDELIRARRFQEAEELLRSRWRAEPGDPDTAGKLALLLVRNHPESGWSEARAVLTTALLRHGERGDLRLALARVSGEQGLTGSALHWLRTAPSSTSHRDEIDALRVTLERSHDRN